METLTIIVADTLRVIGTNTCFPDTMICKVISSQENACSNINWTWVFITAIIAIVLLVWIGTNYCLKRKKMNVEVRAREEQRKWEVDDEKRRRWYKYLDQLLEVHNESKQKPETESEQSVTIQEQDEDLKRIKRLKELIRILKPTDYKSITEENVANLVL